APSSYAHLLARRDLGGGVPARIAVAGGDGDIGGRHALVGTQAGAVAADRAAIAHLGGGHRRGGAVRRPRRQADRLRRRQVAAAAHDVLGRGADARMHVVLLGGQLRQVVDAYGDEDEDRRDQGELDGGDAPAVAKAGDEKAGCESAYHLDYSTIFTTPPTGSALMP